MSADEIFEQIEFEIQQIDRLFEIYADLLQRVQDKTPDVVELTAIASVLHSFYNGLESIFSMVAKGIDGDIPEGAESHRSLLALMIRPGLHRPPLLTLHTAGRLTDYLGFRHFYRHSYSFFLEWEKLEKLVTPLEEVWAQVKGEFVAFLQAIRSM